ncbi:glucosyltransferase domain-containing protein [Kingella negevensis]|uniref:glucosyltransferase domain-containing protein n=1 Tax=Kingella negevensis TaxID=1522312 RepID=UPI002542EB81|nr:glucosyltransferase domain-containing protein [Kingella negevensis]WII94047.1 glucosyltransferase domain-containing protein [Kingella negevensis]
MSTLKKVTLFKWLNLNKYFFEFKKEINHYFNQQAIYPLLFISGIYLLAYSALFLANVYFGDDVSRSVTGERGWDNFSRHTTNFLATILNFSPKLTDIYPLNQLIATAIMAVSSYVLAKLFLQGKHDYHIFAASTILGLNPYFLANISYKYDSPFMALAILSTIFPFIFWKNRALFSVISVLSLLVMWTTYQAANSIYMQVMICLVMMSYFQNGTMNKQINKNIIAAILSFCAAVIMFKLFFYQKSTEAYVDTGLASSLGIVLLNLHLYIKEITSYFSHSSTIIFCEAILLIFFYHVFNRTKARKDFIIAIMTTILMLVFSYGLYFILDRPLFKPRAYNGIGAFFALLAIMNVSLSSQFLLTKIAKWVNGLLIFNLMIIALSYGNALKEYKKYANFRVELVMSDLNHLPIDSFNYQKPIQIKSNPLSDLPSVTQNNAIVFPVIDKLISGQGFWHGTYTIATHYFPDNTYDTHLLIRKHRVRGCDMNNKNAPIIRTIDTIHHTIYQYPDNCFQVEFKQMRPESAIQSPKN